MSLHIDRTLLRFRPPRFSRFSTSPSHLFRYIPALFEIRCPGGRGEKHIEAGTFRKLHDGIGDRLWGIAFDRAAAAAADSPPDSSVEQSQIIVDLGLRRDGRAGITRGILLVDGDRRTD